MLRTREGNVITKHDEDLNGRMNALDMAGRLDHAGDLGDGDFRIPNRVFNQLKHDMKKGESFKGLAARGRVEHATRATEDGVLDPRTRLLLFKMLNKGLFSEVRGLFRGGRLWGCEGDRCVGFGVTGDANAMAGGRVCQDRQGV